MAKKDTVDLFDGESWPSELGLHIWRDKEMVWLMVDFASIRLTVEDFVDFAHIVGLVGKGMEGCCADHVQTYMDNHLKGRVKFIEKEKKREEKEGYDKRYLWRVPTGWGMSGGEACEKKELEDEEEN